MAQRVMDCGDAGHILLSKRIADDLAQYSKWRPCLHDLGECEIKHGARINVVNLYTEEFGNPVMPEKLQREREKHTARAASDNTRAKLPRVAVLMGTSLLLASALGTGLLLFSHRAEQKTTNAPAGNASPLATPSVEKRMAVLPFKPLRPENRDQALELGMADTLITKLSNSREIIVPSLNSVRKYGGLEQDPVAAGRELKVNSILEGNVQKVNDRIRVTARLISVPDGVSLWAGTFDEKFTDVFTLQDAISQKVVDALALRLSGEEKKRLTKRYTENVEAYQLYLTGRYHWSRLTPPDIRKAIGFFQQAIDLDSNYALAYFGLAEANRSLSINADIPSRECLPPKPKQRRGKHWRSMIRWLKRTPHSRSVSSGLIGIEPAGEKKRGVPSRSTLIPRTPTLPTLTFYRTSGAMTKPLPKSRGPGNWTRSFYCTAAWKECSSITLAVMTRPARICKRYLSSTPIFGSPT